MRKLLLADDSITIQKVVELTFTDEGFVVTTVGDGEQALQKLAEEMPDIVLADVFMPGKSGYEVCERIKQDKRFQHIPVMLLVGSFEPYNEAEARRVGANDVLTKPFQSIRQLVNKVGALLGGGDSKHDAAETQHDERRDDAPALSIYTHPSDASHAETNKDDVNNSHAHLSEGFPQSNTNERHEEVAGHIEEAAPDKYFSDPSLDDEMIEATPAENFTHGHDDTSRNTTPLSPVEVRDVLGANAGTNSTASANSSSGEFFEHEISGTTEMPDSGDETLLSFAPAEASVRDVETHGNETMNDAEPRASSTRTMTGTHASDDTLLDLDDIASPSAAATEADDFILDLRDEFNHAPHTDSNEITAPPPSLTAPPDTAHASFDDDDVRQSNDSEAATLLEFEEEMTEAAPQAAAYTEAQNISENEQSDFPHAAEPFAAHTETIEPPHASFIAPAEQEPYGEESHAEETSAAATTELAAADESSPAAFGEVAVPQWDSANTHTSEENFQETPAQLATPQQQSSGEISAQQLSPEIIEQIARRVVEHLSEKVLREIAWEVVPQLAELMIKRRLEEEKTQTP
ncbi:MAG: response regulator [Pyrinomonadaceae bacterium]